MSERPARARGTRSTGLALSVRRATRRGWVPGSASLRQWAGAALGKSASGSELSLLVVGKARSRSLNRHYRGLDYATNVLSFPPAGPVVGPTRHLGDIVICPEVLRREALAQGKAERAHWMHLFIHGVLHLAGHDHEEPAQARRMERREVRVLRALGVADPYRSH